MSTRGEATEAAVLTAFIQRGWDVLVPWASDRPYDLVVSADGEEFLRVQCKSGRERDGKVIFNCHATDHGNGARTYHGRADLFAVYCPTVDEVYVLPVDDLSRRSGWLRLEPARNNQVKRVRFAADHTIDRWIERRAVAAVGGGGRVIGSTGPSVCDRCRVPVGWGTRIMVRV